jgi:hypothetical protein
VGTDVLVLANKDRSSVKVGFEDAKGLLDSPKAAINLTDFLLVIA